MPLHQNTQTGSVYHGNGTQQMHVKNDTGGDLAAGAIGRLLPGGADGMEIAAITTTTGETQQLVVCAEDIVDAEFGRVHTEGSGIVATVPSATYTVGDGLVVDNSSAGIIEGTTTFDMDDAGEFAEIEVGGVTVTSITISLFSARKDVQA